MTAFSCKRFVFTKQNTPFCRNLTQVRRLTWERWFFSYKQLLSGNNKRGKTNGWFRQTGALAGKNICWETQVPSELSQFLRCFWEKTFLVIFNWLAPLPKNSFSRKTSFASNYHYYSAIFSFEIKIKLIFYFHTSLRCLKRFYEGL